MHESVRLISEPARLEGELQHLAYRDLSHHLATIDRYTSLAAQDMAARGRRATRLDLLVHPPLAFLRNYLLRGGIREGRAGPGHLVDERVVRVPQVRQAVGAPRGRSAVASRSACGRTGLEPARAARLSTPPHTLPC